MPKNTANTAIDAPDAPRPRGRPKRVEAVRPKRRKVPIPPCPKDANLAARALHQAAHETWDRIQGLTNDDARATQYAALQRVFLAQLRELKVLLPPEKADPSKDPMNVATRAMVLAHVVRSVEAVEARDGRLCPRCRAQVDRHG
jgi:hypothetical protein